ncbi:MAG: type II toxin-antitoxin system RelE/ParE family toxin [Sphaerochaeta sp.]|jgi:toxin ParE1/3/4
MYKIEILPSALKDLTDVVAYIKDVLDNHRAAVDLARNFYSSILSLQDNPYTHALYPGRIPESKHEFRRMNIRNYAVFYWVEEPARKVVVSRMIYARRDLLKMHEL